MSENITIDLSRIVINMPEVVSDLITLLEEAGYESFIVGGCVRDSYMGIEPKDWDMCTNATPEQMKEVFKDFRTIDTGIKHGTITVHTHKMDIEVTTYRLDVNYTDGRHPDKVTFTTNLEEDLSRRDFTMNAIAYNPKTGFVDPFNGLQDIRNGQLCCVGDANARLQEDALRILRAIRFSLKYNLIPNRKLLNAIIDNYQLLDNISRERIRDELLQILRYAHNNSLLVEGFEQVFDYILPELEYIDFSKTVDLISMFKEETDNTIFLSCLVWDIDSTKHVESLLKSLKLDNETYKQVKQLHKHRFSRVENFYTSEIKQLLRKLEYTQFFRLNAILQAQYQVIINRISNCTTKINEIVANNKCYRLDQLDINGDDICSIGIKEGRLIGCALEDCLWGVVNDKVNNNKSDLINFVKVLYESNINR